MEELWNFFCQMNRGAWIGKFNGFLSFSGDDSVIWVFVESQSQFHMKQVTDCWRSQKGLKKLFSQRFLKTNIGGFFFFCFFLLIKRNISSSIAKLKKKVVAEKLQLSPTLFWNVWMKNMNKTWFPRSSSYQRYLLMPLYISSFDEDWGSRWCWGVRGWGCLCSRPWPWLELYAKAMVRPQRFPAS